MTESQNLDEFLGAKPVSVWQRRGKWIGAGIGLILILLLLARCFNAKQEVTYATEDATRGALTVTVSATGKLQPTNQVEVGSELSGLVEQVLVDVNARVGKGQAIAILDTSRLDDTITQSRATLDARRAAVEQAQATVREAEATLARFREVSKLSGGKVPSKTEMDTAIATAARARADLAAAQANVTQADAQLSSDQTNRSRAVIRSPVNGVVLSRSVDPGQTVAASFNTPTLFVIAEDLRQMKLEASIDEADVGAVKQGQNASFTVDAYPGQTFPAKITRVNLGSDSTSTSSSSSSSTTASASSSSVVAYTAVLSVANPSEQLRPGMTATADILVQEKRNVLLIPNAALRFTPQQATGGRQKSGFMSAMAPGPPGRRNRPEQERTIGAGSRQTIYVLQGNTLKPVQVVTGATDGRHTEVTSDDLKPGMAVVTGQKAAAE
ncbi:efflux RND transporter periplasmic adaptor subunit [Sphingomonas sp. ID0503]|uniref:efflux RND transporter periplasmic adaptor subunit n=1 Tax=Sphingomonas sp. ID0503 TaxID=3399691 RepID=UPI003AFA500C